MPPSFAMGEAAGTAAALALREGVPPRDVPVGWLRDTLRAQGAYVGPDQLLIVWDRRNPGRPSFPTGAARMVAVQDGMVGTVRTSAYHLFNGLACGQPQS
jgi:hypothetical protein